MVQESPSTLIWLLKRILQKFLPDFLWIKRLKEEHNSNKTYVPNLLKPMQSELSRRLLTIQLPYIDKYILARKTNEAIINTFFNQSEKKVLSKVGNYIPYMSSIKCKTDFDTEKN